MKEYKSMLHYLAGSFGIAWLVWAIALSGKLPASSAQWLTTMEGRADGIFTDENGTVTIDEIKTTTVPYEAVSYTHLPFAVKCTIHGDLSPFPAFAAKIKGQRSTGFCPRLQ